MKQNEQIIKEHIKELMNNMSDYLKCEIKEESYEFKIYITDVDKSSIISKYEIDKFESEGYKLQFCDCKIIDEKPFARALFAIRK